MPRSLWDDANRRYVLARVARLTPDTPPRWGRFSAGAMLAHLNDYSRLALGDLSMPPVRGPLATAPGRWLAVHVLPMTRGLTAPPVLLTTPPAAFEVDRADFGRLLARCAARGPTEPWPVSPLFGPLTGPEWGALAYKHADHHLRQFGV